ncbi:potassium transporter KefB [bacterium]|nr:MAG: potassium transporter KefB [bacterium]
MLVNLLLSMQIPVFEDIAIIFVIGLFILFIAQKFKVPNILAFLVTGLFIGPHGMAWVSSPDEIEIMAEIGIVLLLFTIGMEFSIGSLKAIKYEVFIGGTLQVLLTVLFTAGIMTFITDWKIAFFLGMFASLSSTAIVLKTLLNRGDLSTKEGKASLSILIFQDLAVVPMMLVLPMMNSGSDVLGYQAMILILKTLATIALVVVLSKFVTNPVLEFIAKTRNNEFFLVFAIAICAGVAIFSGEMGLSLGLGAFLAGFTLAESPYVHQAASGVIPFRDLFTIFFFVSIGMLLDLQIVVQFPLIIVLGVIGVITLKAGVIFGVLKLIRYRTGQSLAVAFMLSQVGEFSIVLSKVAFGNQVIDNEIYQIVLAICLVSMSVTPALFWLADKSFLLDTKRKRQVALDLVTKSEKKELKEHVVIVGYGVIGKAVAQAAKGLGMPYAVIEFNPETVKLEKKLGTVIIYGDATQRVVLDHVNISKARILVVSIPDAQAVRHVVDTVSKNFPDIYIIARTRYVGEVEHLLHLGAHEVIPEEFETSISIFDSVLNRLGVDSERRTEMVSSMRNEDYEALRNPMRIEAENPMADRLLQGMCVNKYAVEPGQPWLDKSLVDINLRKEFGLSVVAIIKQNQQSISNPDPSTLIEEGDSVVIMGEREKQLEWINQWGLVPEK